MITIHEKLTWFILLALVGLPLVYLQARIIVTRVTLATWEYTQDMDKIKNLPRKTPSLSYFQNLEHLMKVGKVSDWIGRLSLVFCSFALWNKEWGFAGSFAGASLVFIISGISLKSIKERAEKLV